MPYQKPLPVFYTESSDAELISLIQANRKKLGEKLLLLAHHYQRPEIVALGDYRGDSLKLAQYAVTRSDVEYIVYCGVHFMAESADIIVNTTANNCKVLLPDLGAGCDMADMAESTTVEEAWESICKIRPANSILPVTYINSTAAIKAFVGRNGGTVCTSSNAEKIVRWAIEQNKQIFFLPDQHLGRYTCYKLGLPLESQKVWQREKPLGGLTEAEIKEAKVLLWDGCCPVHMQFTAKHVDNILAKDPEFKIVVHSECSLDVIQKADAVGSTELIINTIKNSPPGSKWAVGTEMNLVTRIIDENSDKNIVSLNPFMCLCGTMNRIDLPHLAWIMQELVEGRVNNLISVKEPIRSQARIALTKMLELS